MPRAARKAPASRPIILDNSPGSGRIYTRLRSKFPSLLDVLDENNEVSRQAGQVLGVVSAIAVSMAAHSVNVTDGGPANWHRAFKPHFLAWVHNQYEQGEMENMRETDEKGHQIPFINELRAYIQPKVKSSVPAKLRSKRSEFDGLEEPYAIWAIRVTRKACSDFDDELLEVAKHHFTTARAKDEFTTYEIATLERVFRETAATYLLSMDFPPFVATPHRPGSYVFKNYANYLNTIFAEDDFPIPDTPEHTSVYSSSEPPPSSPVPRQITAGDITPTPDRDDSSSPTILVAPAPTIQLKDVMNPAPSLILPPFWANISADCDICKDKFGIKEAQQGMIMRAKNCAHVFHRECFMMWINGGQDGVPRPTCPYCRGSVLDSRV